jgi:predicted TIM-barrel fold metal-dependent hydrolase
MVVWDHTGSYLSPSNISDFLREYPNISFDLSAKNPACCPAGYSQNYPLMGIRSIDETWRQLFETYPDRFLVGVDFLSSSHLRDAREAGEFYRTILGQLTPATARKIGYQNAQRLYDLG